MSEREPIPASLWEAEEFVARQHVIDQLVEQGVDRQHLESLTRWEFTGFVATHAVKGAPVDTEPWLNALKTPKILGT